jgi:glutamate--cysteine ligase
VDRLSERLRWLQAADNATVIRGGLRGVEKESLRVDARGRLSQLPHPKGLGSALTHQFITTDYSEALLEFVTPAYAANWETLQFLCDLHQFTYAQIDPELLWAASMPCLMEEEHQIPIAVYGDSNVGRMKTIYRVGLGHRYGRKMQTISGIHFNYSLPEKFWPAFKDLERPGADVNALRSEMYMGLVRNYRRWGWLILYLFGASPALCKSFHREQLAGLQDLDGKSWYGPFATSLRMSDLGYQNKSQAHLRVSANSLEEYIDELSRAISTPSSAYQKIGVKVEGEYRQLNANVLQIENEYYSTVRPKRRAETGERPTLALRRAGVEYIEVRALDVNLFHPIGVGQVQTRLLEAFLIYCMLMDSPPIDAAEQDEIEAREAAVARRGREPGLVLNRGGKATPLQDWAMEILEGVGAVAELLDEGDGAYEEAVALQRAAVNDPQLTPSAGVLREMRERRLGFFHLALDVSREHRQYFLDLYALPDAKQTMLSREARDSVRRQEQLEAQQHEDFANYLDRYYEGLDDPVDQLPVAG